MWQRVKTFCLNSTTIAWSYVLSIVGGLLQVVDGASDILGDPSFKDTIRQTVGDPKMVGYIFLFISMVNIICRVRSLGRGR